MAQAPFEEGLTPEQQFDVTAAELNERVTEALAQTTDQAEREAILADARADLRVAAAGAAVQRTVGAPDAVAELQEAVAVVQLNRLRVVTVPLLAVPVSPSFAAALEALRVQMEAGIAASFRGATAFATELAEQGSVALQNVAALLAQLRVDLASQLVTQQSESEKRAQAQQELDETAGEGGLFGFIGRVRDFVTSPFDRLLTAIGEWFLEEVSDGLNR